MTWRSILAAKSISPIRRTSEVWFIDAKGNKRVVHEGILFPNGVRFSPDHAFLMVADTLSRWVWSFSVQPDGSLANGVPFYRLEIPDEVESGPLRSGADGMTVDADGFFMWRRSLGSRLSIPAEPLASSKAGQQRPFERRIRRSRSADTVCHFGRQGVPAADQEKRHIPMGGGDATEAAAVTSRARNSR